MKKILVKLLTCLMVPAVLVSAMPTTFAATSEKTLKILAIGNSFSDDMMEYVWHIAKDLGYEDIYLGNLYIPNCNIQSHWSNYLYNKRAYEYRVNSNGTWSTTPQYRLKDAVREQEWDFITMQQASGFSGDESSYRRLVDLANGVQELAPDAKLVWHMTWAYQQNSNHSDFPKYNNSQTDMYNSIVSVVTNTVVPTEKFQMVVPNGTAIQNARTSFVGDNLTRDGYHLSIPFGRYVAGLTLVHALTGQSLDNLTYSPGLTDAYREVAVRAAYSAVKNPYAVTDLSKEPGDVNGDGVVDAKDALAALKHAVGKPVLSDDLVKLGDLNGDGILDAKDALAMLKIAVEP